MSKIVRQWPVLRFAGVEAGVLRVDITAVPKEAILPDCCLVPEVVDGAVTGWYFASQATLHALREAAA